VVGHFLDRGAIKPVLISVVGFQMPLMIAAAFFDNHLMLVVAIGMMFFVFGQIPINDAMVAAYTDEAWRSRMYAVRYVVSFGASACAVPLVALMHRYSSDFRYLFFALAAMAVVMLAAALLLPSHARQHAPA
jgi:predicted MFS family arabinose efflux permease